MTRCWEREREYMYKNDAYYIRKIREHILFISEHMEGVSQDDLEKQPVLQDSMMFRLVQISESAKYLSEGFLEKHANIPWTDIFGLRNRIVHDYGNVNLRIVYETLTIDIPVLAEALSDAELGIL